MMNKIDPYKILEVNKLASQAEIKASYHRLALKYHPDRNPDNPKAATEKFKLIAQAYEILGTPEKRKEYDNQHNTKHHPDYQTQNESTTHTISEIRKTVVGLSIGLAVFFLIEIVFYTLGFISYVLLFLFKWLIKPRLFLFSNIIIASFTCAAFIAYKKGLFSYFIKKCKEVLIKVFLFLLLLWIFHGYHFKSSTHHYGYNSLMRTNSKYTPIRPSRPIKSLSLSSK